MEKKDAYKHPQGKTDKIKELARYAEWWKTMNQL